MADLRSVPSFSLNKRIDWVIRYLYKNVKAFNKFVKVHGYSIEADRDEGRVSFKQKLPEMKEKAAEQTKANPVAENAKKKAQEIA